MAESQRDLLSLILDAAIDSISDPMLIFTPQLDILKANSAALFLFPISSFPAPATGILPEMLLKFVQGQAELPEWTPDEDRAYIPRLFPVLPEERTQGYQILLLRDISQYKKLSRNHYEFMRIVTHDLRSPLTSMQGFANMLELGLVGELNEKQRQFVEKILAGIAQMTSLVENIQDAGRFDPETGFYEMVREPCDVVQIVSEIVKEHLLPAEKQELTLSAQSSDDVPIINADANMLERAITNLVDNAIKYTPNGGKIEIKVFTQDRHIVVGVSDNGLGISEENKKRLFQRHQRIARQEHKRVKGSGLGLFIVRSVAQRHGGDAWVESVEGKGSTFYIRLPIEGASPILQS